MECYFREFDINPDYLRDKKILDVGCNRGEFVQHLLDFNITNKAYGLDIKNANLIISQKHFIHQDYKIEIKEKEFDLILFRLIFTSADIPNTHHILKRFINNNLSDGGEIRVRIHKTGLYYRLWRLAIENLHQSDINFTISGETGELLIIKKSNN